MTERLHDALVFDTIEREERRQLEGIELIASENFVSPAVLKAQGSVLTNKYAEGYPGRRYYGGCEYIDVIEQAAIDRAKELFGAEYANVQPHSGSSANLAVYRAFLNVGDRVLGMDLSQGGHLTHQRHLKLIADLFKLVLTLQHNLIKEILTMIENDNFNQIIKQLRTRVLKESQTLLFLMVTDADM